MRGNSSGMESPKGGSMTPAKWRPSRRSRWRQASIIGTLAAVLSVVGLLGSGAAAQAATNPGTTTVHFTVAMHRTASGKLLPGRAAPADEVVLNYTHFALSSSLVFARKRKLVGKYVGKTKCLGQSAPVICIAPFSR